MFRHNGDGPGTKAQGAGPTAPWAMVLGPWPKAQLWLNICASWAINRQSKAINIHICMVGNIQQVICIGDMHMCIFILYITSYLFKINRAIPIGIHTFPIPYLLCPINGILVRYLKWFPL